MKCYIFYLLWLSLYRKIFCDENKCKQGIRYWCKDENTALECGTLFICKFENNFREQKSEIAVRFETVSRDAAPVNVTLFYESLCPDCQQVWNYQLYPTYQKLKGSGILNIELVPYGNAQETAYGNQWIFYCQHGQAECTGNIIETCAIKLNPDQNQFIPFVYCLEYYGPTLTNAQYCASLGSLNFTQIEACSQGLNGNMYEHEMALKTASLNPPHQYVPWFTMNGYHDDEIQQQLTTNMLAYVCSSYAGTKPDACYQAKDNHL